MLILTFPVAAAEIVVGPPPEQDGALCDIHFASGNVMSAIPAAVTPSAQHKGLSGITAPHEQSMLFWWHSPGFRSFWMHDVSVALDIAFLSETGKLIQLETVHPGDTQVYRSKRPVKLVVEQPAGYFASHNVWAGDTLVEINCEPKNQGS